MGTNYEAGRRFEYERMKYWREVLGFRVIRAAGSHGEFDLIAYDEERGVHFIQCKLVATVTTAERLLEKFRTVTIPFNQPRTHKILEVKVKGSTEIRSFAI